MSRLRSCHRIRQTVFAFVESMIKTSLLPKDVFRHDIADRADVAIVVGSPDPEHLRHRISAGVSLIKSGKTAKLILSGDGRKKDPENRSEADRMRAFAINAGVTANAIITEDTSHDSIENAKECTRLLKTDSTLQGVKSVFLVSSAWHMLRLFIMMRRYLPNKISLYCHPATEGVTAANWQTSPQTRAIVDNELRLIEKLLKTGFSLR